MGLPGVVEPECLDTLRVFFLIHFIVQFDFVPGFSLSWVLVPWFSVSEDCGYNSSLLPFPWLGLKRGLRNMPRHSASKPLKLSTCT